MILLCLIHIVNPKNQTIKFGVFLKFQICNLYECTEYDTVLLYEWTVWTDKYFVQKCLYSTYTCKVETL